MLIDPVTENKQYNDCDNKHVIAISMVVEYGSSLLPHFFIDFPLLFAFFMLDHVLPSGD